MAHPHSPAAVSAGKIRICRKRAHGPRGRFADFFWLHHFRRLGPELRGVSVCTRELLHRNREQHFVFARERGTQFPHPQSHRRAGRAHSRRNHHRLRCRSRPRALLRHRQRHHGRDPRLLFVREPRYRGLLHERVGTSSRFSVQTQLVLLRTGNRELSSGTLLYSMSLSLRRIFHKEKQERRILRQIERTGDRLEPEYHRPTPECPHPERWRMFDSMTAEAEVLEFLRTLVPTIKPE